MALGVPRRITHIENEHVRPPVQPARHLGDTHLLVLGTYRDVEVRRGHPLAQLLGTLAHEPVCERVTLRVRVGDSEGLGLRRLIQLIEESGDEDR